MRVIGKLRFTHQGYVTKSFVSKKELTFSAYQGTLPWGFSFADQKETLDQKLGFASKAIGRQLSWTDKAARRRTLVGFNEAPNATIQYVLVLYTA